MGALEDPEGRGGSIHIRLMVLKMEKTYWENRYREGESSTSACTEWNWDEEVCEIPSPRGCHCRGPNGECTNTIGSQRAWKWKVIREAIRKYSPELVKSKTHLCSPPEPGAGLIRDPRSKRTIQDPVKMRPESASHSVLSKVIDVGCGDLIFWRAESLRLAHPQSWHTHGIMRTEEYMGIDISETVITRNRGHAVRGWSFIISPAHILNQGLGAPVVFCMDLLFHIMDDMAFIETLKNLCHYSEDLIFIHTWKYNPFKDSTSDGIYQKYRLLKAYFGIFVESGFTLMEERVNPNRVGCMYVFKRKDDLFLF